MIKIFSENFFYGDMKKYRDQFLKLINAKTKYILTENGNAPKYLKALEIIPEIKPSVIDMNSDRIKIGTASDINQKNKKSLLDALYKLTPWRKGPYDLFGIKIDSEWESYLKWNRIKNKITPLQNRKILDIGSSSGYYMFKIASSKPELIIGLEPYLTFYFQFKILQHYINLPNIFCIPAKMEELPVIKNYFDTVFCMGILYHIRSPIDFLKLVNKSMKRGGEIIVETLIIKGNESTALFPEKRYARMNNIYFIPTVRCLINWLKRSGFQDIECVDITKTTTKEQKKTEWIDTQSLEDFLDKNNPDKTVEGYQAPIRAVIIAKAGSR